MSKLKVGKDMMVHAVKINKDKIPKDMLERAEETGDNSEIHKFAEENGLAEIENIRLRKGDDIPSHLPQEVKEKMADPNIELKGQESVKELIEAFSKDLKDAEANNSGIDEISSLFDGIRNTLSNRLGVSQRSGSGVSSDESRTVEQVRKTVDRLKELNKFFLENHDCCDDDSKSHKLEKTAKSVAVAIMESIDEGDLYIFHKKLNDAINELKVINLDGKTIKID